MNKKIYFLAMLIITGISFSQISWEDLAFWKDLTFWDEITYKELKGAKQLYENGSVDKARSLIEVMRNDKDKKLAEQANYLKFKLFNEIYVPVESKGDSQKTVNYISALSKDFSKFKKTYSKSKFISKIENLLNKSGKSFTEIVNGNKNKLIAELNDSCTIDYKPDSTFIFCFEKAFVDSQKKAHTLKISFSGKLKNYEPYGDMKDEWGSTGLILDTNGIVSIVLDSLKIVNYSNPISIKQYPEYILRRVTEFGFSQDKTFIREDDVENQTRIGVFLDENLIISNLKLKLKIGKMHELVPYYSDNPESTFPNNFRSKAYVELNIICKQ